MNKIQNEVKRKRENEKYDGKNDHCLQIVFVYILLGYNRTQGEKVLGKFKL
jgi:hypothetical protein